MKTCRAAAISMLCLAACLQAGLLHAEERRYVRWEGDAIPFAVDAAFLSSKAWDLRRPATGSALRQEGAEPGDGKPFRDRRRVGLGILQTPAGEFPSVLYRETVRLPEGRTAVQYRWIGSGHTTLALLRGPAGGSAPTFDASTLIARLESGVPEVGIRVYNDQLGPGVLSVPGGSGAALRYTFDASPNTDPAVTVPLSGITAQGYATGGALTSATIWDFTPVSGLANNIIAETDVPVSLDETCNAERCGFNMPTIDFISRQDNLTTGNLTVAAFENETLCDGGTDDGLACLLTDGAACPGGTCVPRTWLRAGAQLEGTNMESRFCYDGQADPQGQSRGQVRQWSFPNPDGGRNFMQVGDAWLGDLFACSSNLFNENCGASQGIFIPRVVETAACESFSGRFSTQVLTEGSVKLPSGHWVDTLVMQQTAEFCVYLTGNSCTGIIFQRVRQPVVLFVTPFEGAVAQVNGPLQATDLTSWSGVNETVIRFGLLPPLSTTLGGVTGTTVDLSWDPGNQFGFIDRVKVYWGTSSGSYTDDSELSPGAVAFGPNGPDGIPLGATISGLTPNVEYFFSVTFLDTFTEPDATPFAYEYESNLFPQTIAGTVDGVPGNEVEYPAEVSAITPCAPGTEVTNLDVAPAGGGNFTFSWDAVADACLTDYVLLAADDPSAAANFAEVARTGTTPSHVGNPGLTYYLVRVESLAGQQGPLGHFGQ